MNKTLILLILLNIFSLEARHKVYLVHGFAGHGMELQRINNYLQRNGIESEIFSYRSLTYDIDTVSSVLYQLVKAENRDSVSFVTHSMGALIARSVYNHIKPGEPFPFIHRMVMIAPPNRGSPVADFFVHSRLIESMAGPNLHNLTTDEATGASRYPIPDCEVGIILGVSRNRRGFNLFLEENNDGLVLPRHAKLGIEKDIAFLKASHTAILFRNKTRSMVLQFLRTGRFQK